jgi:hypothetical protein
MRPFDLPDGKRLILGDTGTDSELDGHPLVLSAPPPVHKVWGTAARRGFGRDRPGRRCGLDDDLDGPILRHTRHPHAELHATGLGDLTAPEEADG